MTVLELLAETDEAHKDSGLLDEGTKREIRRATLVAVCVPGYQVPFGSREMPVARGWGSGGLQVTLGVVGPDDTLKVIDQGDDGGVNATNLRRLVTASEGCASTTDARAASVIQTRHRVPEEALSRDQVLVYQVPVPEPLRGVQKSVAECARMHAQADYSAMWVSLYEDLVRNGVITKSTGYPVLVNNRYVMSTTPVPRWDVPRLHQCEHLNLYGAGREKRIYAIPPHTDVTRSHSTTSRSRSNTSPTPAAPSAAAPTPSWSKPATPSHAAPPNGAQGFPTTTLISKTTASPHPWPGYPTRTAARWHRRPRARRPTNMSRLHPMATAALRGPIRAWGRWHLAR